MSYFEEEEYKKPLSIKVWAKLLPFLKPFKGKLFTIIFAMLICSLVDVLFPIMQSFAVENFIIPKQSEGLFPFSLIYLFMLLAQVTMVLLFCRIAMTVEMCIGRELKKAAFEHLQTLSFSYYNQTPVGYIMARVMSDTNRLGGLVAWGLVDVLWSITYVIGSFVSMFILNAKLALIVSLVVPFIAIITVLFQRKILKVNRDLRRTNSRLTGAFNEGIMGAKTSKSLVIEDKNLSGFTDITKDMYRHSIHSVRLNALYLPIILFFSSIAVSFVLAQGGYLVMGGTIGFGVLSAFVTYSISVFEPIQQIARNFAEFIASQANVERVTDLLEKKPDITDTPEVIEKYGDSFNPKRGNWEELNGDIEFCDVSFKYPDGGDYVLEHFNLMIKAGTNVAIVGETGAGKSTLVNLACRFFEPTDGKILIDGRDYKERSQLWLHSNIGYVLQNPHLFSGTIRENLRYGRLDATDEEIERACELVSADTIIKKMEKGYDTDVGESGDRLSTGEKQLISFARAILANPRIFVLDEATSSIDTATEQLIQNAISTMLENRTSFLIAHRLSTIKRADIILVVKNGKIIESGTHRELLRQKGHYYHLYLNQFEQEAGWEIVGREEE